MARSEYIALAGSFILVGFEAIIRILTLALRMCDAEPTFNWNFLTLI